MITANEARELRKTMDEPTDPKWFSTVNTNKMLKHLEEVVTKSAKGGADGVFLNSYEHILEELAIDDIETISFKSIKDTLTTNGFQILPISHQDNEKSNFMISWSDKPYDTNK